MSPSFADVEQLVAYENDVEVSLLFHLSKFLISVKVWTVKLHMTLNSYSVGDWFHPFGMELSHWSIQDMFTVRFLRHIAYLSNKWTAPLWLLFLNKFFKKSYFHYTRKMIEMLHKMDTFKKKI